MRYASILLILVFASLYSCNTISPTDLTLDDLVDKKEYTGGIIVDCSSYKGKQVELVLLNGTEQEDPYILELLSAGYYRIEIFLPESGPDLPEVIRIVILDSERGETEWGLPPWTPLEQENGKIADQSVRLIHAPSAPLNLTIPMVVLLNDELNLSELFLDAEIGSSGFRIKRGVGSVQIPANSSQLGLRIDDQNFQLNIDDIDTAPQILSGELSADMQIQAGSYIHIPNDLTIPEGISLSIESGTFLTVAPEVNIYNNGVMQITGTAMAPVTISCSNNEAYWGGFIGNSNGNRIDATYTIFSRSGYHTGGEYAYGHAGRDHHNPRE